MTSAPPPDSSVLSAVAMRPSNFDAFPVWSPPVWRARRPDAEGFWESRSVSAGEGSIDRFVIYMSAGELRYGAGDGVTHLEESRDREWRGPIVP